MDKQMKNIVALTLLAFLLNEAANAQCGSAQMPGMKMSGAKSAPAKSAPAQTPNVPASPAGSPGMQTPQGAEPNVQQQQQEQSTPQMQMGGAQMEVRSPEHIATDVEHVQEPENPSQQTGTDTPVADWLSAARNAPRRTLAEFEQQAVSSSPAVKESEALVRSSAGLARQAGLWSNPSIGYQGEQIRGGSFGGGEQGAFIQQNIVLGGKLRARREVYEQQRKGDEITAQAQKQSVLGAVRMQFYTALAAQRMVEVKQQLLSLSLDAATTAHQLANVGQADAPDVLQAESEAEQAKLDLESAQQDYIGQYKMLAALAGDSHSPLALLEGALEEPPAIDSAKLYQDLLANSPAVQQAEQEVARAQAVLMRNKKEVFPDLTLRVGEQQNFEQTSSMKPAGAQSFATASVQLPVFNRNQGNVEAAQAEVLRAQAEVERTRLSLMQRAQPLLQQYAVGRLRSERYRTQIIPRAQRAYELNLQKYRSMAAAYPAVLISQRTLFELQQKYIQTLGQLWMASEQLQNYLMTDGLGASGASASRGTEVNLPTGGPGSAQ